MKNVFFLLQDHGSWSGKTHWTSNNIDKEWNVTNECYIIEKESNEVYTNIK